jgi:NTP-dependent ternary system trypsin peptidase co-occuring protein
MDNDEIEVVDASLPNGVVVGVEVPRSGGAANVSALDHLDFDQVQRAIEGLAEVVGHALEKIRPQRASAELSLGLKVETGKLSAVLVQAGGSASIKISLGWERQPVGVETTATPATAADGQPADASE